MTDRTVAAGRAAANAARRRGLLRLALVAVLLLVAGGYVSPAYNFYTRSGEIDAEKGTQEELQARNEQLLLEKERLLEEPFIEATARQELGLVKPGEQSYIVEEIDDPPVRAEAVAPETPEMAVKGLLTMPFSSAAD